MHRIRKAALLTWPPSCGLDLAWGITLMSTVTGYKVKYLPLAAELQSALLIATAP